jgi:phenylacetate-CoA ligase
MILRKRAKSGSDPDSHYDRLETRSPRLREASLMRALPRQIAHAQRYAPGFARILKGINPRKIISRKALASLPVTRKSDLPRLQQEMPPLGGLNATPIEGLTRVFLSPGHIHDPMGNSPDWWRTARGLFAGGFRKGDLVVNTFSYHFTPAGAMLESGALAIGCTVVPTGVGQTEMQVAAIRSLGANAFVGTPSFLKLIVEKADELKADISSLKKAQVGAEYLPPTLRTAMAQRGIRVSQCYASADLGLIAYESLMPDGAVNEGMILDEGLLLEIVRPGTGDPVPPGEVGEVVITSFNRDYPLIRFATGDLSAVLPGASPCGRTNTRIRGWMGRADQSTKVRAMFVTPGQVAEVLRRHPEVLRARLVVEGEAGNDRMTLRCEIQHPLENLREAIVTSIRDITKLRGEVELVSPGSLPNDGKVIEDARKYG